MGCRLLICSCLCLVSFSATSTVISPTNDDSSLRVMTWNTFLAPNYRTLDDVEMIAQFVDDHQLSHNLDVVCLQEVSSFEFLEALISFLPSFSFHAYTAVESLGLSEEIEKTTELEVQTELLCFSKYEMKIVKQEVFGSAQAVLIMTVQKGENKWLVEAAHLPAGNSEESVAIRQKAYDLIDQTSKDCSDCVASVFLGDTNEPENSAIFSHFPLFEPVGQPTGGYAEKGIYCQSGEFGGTVYPREVDRIFAVRNARRSEYEVFDSSCQEIYSDHRALFAEFQIGAQQKVFIIRHGDRSDYENDNENDNESEEDPIDYGNNSPISSIGKLQAQLVGENVAQNYSLGAVLVSPFLRTLQSAMYLKQENSKFIQVEPGVQEDRSESNPLMPVAPDFISIEEWTEIISSEDQSHSPLVEVHLPENDESYTSRIREAVQNIQEAYPVETYGNIAIVTHATPSLSLAIGFCENSIGQEFGTVNSYLSHVAEITSFEGKMGIASSSLITIERTEETECLQLPQIDNSVWQTHPGPTDPFMELFYEQYWDVNDINEQDEGANDSRSRMLMGVPYQTMVIVMSISGAVLTCLVVMLCVHMVRKRRGRYGRLGGDLAGAAVDLGV